MELAPSWSPLGPPRPRLCLVRGAELSCSFKINVCLSSLKAGGQEQKALEYAWWKHPVRDRPIVHSKELELAYLLASLSQ